MTIELGTRLGPYEILAPVGAGGMGEVYKAKDTRLDRTVAIKVLPEHLAESPERKARFEREAKAISQLNHPHICTLYDIGHQDGVDFIVMEYLEGETLAERLKKGALPLDKALEYGVQIADGLDKAHRAGIVHRDLKPGNIMLTDSGVKLLNFGLAKILAGDTEAAISDAPTRQKDLTEEQAIIGTLQYMAPEQLEGKGVDARTDVFAYGAVLYEMVTGRRAFEGESRASIIAAIMGTVPPNVHETAPLAPPMLDTVVAKALAKSSEDRWQSMRDVGIVLGALSDQSPTPEPSETAAHRRARRVVGWALVLIASAFIAGLLLWSFYPAAPDLTTRVMITLPDGQRLVERSTSPIALSPDGRRLVYAAADGERSRLYLRELDSFQATPIPGTEGGHTPFFSPDGNWVGFFTEDALKKVAVDGGAPIVLAPAEALSQGASWSRDGTIVYAPSSGTSGSGWLMRVPEGGGTTTQLTERGYYPHVLPGGKRALYWTGTGQGLVLVSLSTGEEHDVEGLEVAGALYVPSGHLVFPSSTSSLAAVPFDTDGGEPSGEAITVIDGVLAGRDRQPYLAFSETGTLAFVRGEDTTLPLVRVGRDGRTAAPPLVRHPIVHAPRFSPDGRKVAYDTQPDIWVYDLDRDTRTRLTVGLGSTPAWSADGDRIAFHSPGNLYHMPADGSSDAEVVFSSGEVDAQNPAWSFGGRYLVFAQSHPDTGEDIWVLPFGEEAIPFLVTAADEGAPRFSPDDRFIVYMSNESGDDEIYVRPFPGAGRRWQVSSDGGTEPVWSRDGGEIFYRHGPDIMVVEVDTSNGFDYGRPRRLFSSDEFRQDLSGHPSYDVSPDARSLVMIQEASDEPLTEIHVVFNWFQELERLVPTGE